MNEHDLESFLECFDSDYQSEQPVHPDRAFSGREQVRKNWSGIFGSISDFKAELPQIAVQKDRAWAEWHWYGTEDNGTPFGVRGVTIFGINGGRIVWGRLYMEPVEQVSNK